MPAGFSASQGFDRPLRRIKFNGKETGKTLVFLTYTFAVPAMTIARLDKYRWQVELFFKWIKQHLRIKAFFGTSENAVKAQIWSAICVYRVGRHRQEAARHRREPLRNPTDFEPRAIRKNRAIPALSRHSSPNRTGGIG
jgi:IS4 transposase